MTYRKAFTLMELLVVIGIILVLMGILLPAVSHVRRQAQITGQKADFQTIATALEAYKADFGDYPRNDLLPRFNTNNGQTPAPVHLSLAQALLGPGPAVTQVTTGGIYQVGDGADGLGSRGQTVNVPVAVTALSLTASPFTVTIGSVPPQLNAFIPGQTQGSIVLSVGTTYEETVGFTVDPTVAGQLDLTAQPVYSGSTHSTSDKYIVRILNSKVTQNYLSPDTFKVAFVPTAAPGAPGSGQSGPAKGVQVGPAGEPVLLDRWGQVIQYFPRYGNANNRYSDSVSKTGLSTTTIQSTVAGPLFGYSQPQSIDPTSSTLGQNAIWDWRDAAPFYQSGGAASYAGTWNNPVTGNNDSFDSWPDPTNDTSTGFQPELALQWMLGDTPTGAKFNNAIISGDKLNYDGPYILISAGPDGPERLNGGYCNFNGVATNQLQSTFQNSGNIYNFDKP